MKLFFFFVFDAYLLQQLTFSLHMPHVASTYMRACVKLACLATRKTLPHHKQVAIAVFGCAAANLIANIGKTIRHIWNMFAVKITATSRKRNTHKHICNYLRVQCILQRCNESRFVVVVVVVGQLQQRHRQSTRKYE